MKILTIIGARPQFIKASVVSKAIAEEGSIEEIIVHTGQHFDDQMSKVFFDELNIPKPNYNLNINQLSHGAMTGEMIKRIEELIISEKPEFTMVYGDTNSTLAGALASKKLRVKVAHVEAGLRSFNMNMPEEINRILTDRISDLLFCPTQAAIKNLKNEGFENFSTTVVHSGDVMEESCYLFSQYARKPDFHIPEVFILATVHRAENTESPHILNNIINAIKQISVNTPVIFPLHPGTRNKIEKEGIDLNAQNLLIINPLGYIDMLYLLKKCKFILTDSGGLQKEAYFMNKICYTLRNETEWTELVQSNANYLVGTERDGILNNIKNFSDHNSIAEFGKRLYGTNEKASSIIVKELLRYQN